jgi:hypothetical protein
MASKSTVILNSVDWWPSNRHIDLSGCFYVVAKSSEIPMAFFWLNMCDFDSLNLIASRYRPEICLERNFEIFIFELRFAITAVVRKRRFLHFLVEITYFRKLCLRWEGLCLWKALDLCYESSEEIFFFFRFACQKANFRPGILMWNVFLFFCENGIFFTHQTHTHRQTQTFTGT